MLIYYRGESKCYDGTSCKPSILRVFSTDQDVLKNESAYYNAVYNHLKDHAIMKDADASQDDEKWVYRLAVFQHYGFATRFLDITAKLDVAAYFACCSNFGFDGLIYHFKKEKEYTNIDRKHITRKLQVVLQMGEDLSKKDILGAFGRESTIRDNVIIDNMSFGFKSENLRQKRQEGKFVLFGNDIQNNKILASFPNFQAAEVEKISKEEKLNKLIDLNRRGINYVYLFPDDTLSMKIQTLFLKMKTNKIDCDDYSFLIKNDIIKKRICEELSNRREIFIKNENGFYFIVKELVDYINEMKEENTGKIMAVIDRILK